MAAHLKNIAIIGAGGHIGKPFTNALLKTNKHNVTALTRAGSTSKIPAGVKVVEIDYDSEESMIAALKGQQFLVISLGVLVPEEVHGKVVRAAAKAGVAYIMPNVHGVDPRGEGEPHPILGTGFIRRIQDVEDTGVPWIVLTTGFWYEWSLALGDNWYGIDINKKKAWFCDKGHSPQNTSTWSRCGEAFANLLSLPESGASPSLAEYKNNSCYVDSFVVTQRKMLDSVQRATGTTDEDWEITCEPAEKRYKDGLAEMQTNPRRGFPKALYAHSWSKDGGREYTQKLDNDKLGLKPEDLDAVTKKVVEKVQNGWDPRVEW
ncbi:hypothetical protein LOCC1_G006622 [Lachnellula occidentalis]|uniref:NmrA-like domain-containing protein n=1 Tax=Lachnellula occidentalis TaxID=215460 RepID=A0A8H8RNE5_9HELO|nr:hypothetical protein LOCC1_G006622 [Lachnellula occidentalis]